MKRKLTVVLACMLLCMLVIAGCGGSSEGVVGTWKLTSMESNGETVGEEMLNQASIEMTFTFEEGDQFSASLMGSTVEGTYTLEGSKLTMTVDGEPAEAELSGNTFVVEESDIRMIFTKQ